MMNNNNNNNQQSQSQSPSPPPQSSNAAAAAGSQTSTTSSTSTSTSKPPATKEYKLLSSGPTLPYHLMKVNAPNFDWKKMLRPVRLVRGRRRRAVKTEEDGKTGEGVDGEDDGDNANDQISSLTKEGEGDGEGEGDPNKPKADLNKIAPFGGAGQPRKPVQKKKMKTYILSAKDEENWKRENLDRYPWVLTDFDNVPEKTYEGKLDGEIGDQYVLFVFSNDGFKVVPCSKRYRFNQRIHYTTLSAEEANEMMGKKIGKVDRFLALKSQQAGSKYAQQRRRAPKASTSDDDDDEGGRGRSRHRAVDVEDDGMDYDYDEMFQDDDAEQFEFDDAEMADEAKRRIRTDQRMANRGFVEGVAVSEDEEEDGEEEDDEKRKKRIKAEREHRKQKKMIAMAEKNDMYESDDDEKNPYLSSDDEEEDEEEDDLEGRRKSGEAGGGSSNARRGSQERRASNKDIMEDLFGESKYGVVSASNDVTSGHGIVKVEKSSSSSYNKSGKRPREDETSGLLPGATSSSTSFGIAVSSTKKIKIRRDGASPAGSRSLSPAGTTSRKRSISPNQSGSSTVVKRERSMSPAQQPTASAARSRSQSPLGEDSTSSSNANLNLITDEIIINLIRDSANPMTVKDVIAALKPYFKANPNNRSLVKKILSKVIKKETMTSGGALVLKDEYLVKKEGV